MPDPSLKESRRPELRLPEFKRDDIVKVLSERLPDVDLSKLDLGRLDRPKVDLPKVDLPRVDLPRVDLPDLRKVDLRGALDDVAVRAGVRERTRSRWPLVVGMAIVACLGVWALLQRPRVRAQVEDSARKTRARIDRMREDREAREAQMGQAGDRAWSSFESAAPDVDGVAEAVDDTVGASGGASVGVPVMARAEDAVSTGDAMSADAGSADAVSGSADAVSGSAHAGSAHAVSDQAV